MTNRTITVGITSDRVADEINHHVPAEDDGRNLGCQADAGDALPEK